MDYTYAFPDTEQYKNTAIAMIESPKLKNIISQCKIDFEDKGLSYYYDKSNSAWDKHSLLVKLYTPPKSIEKIRQNNVELSNIFSNILPSESGFLLSDIIPIPDMNSDKFNIDLPEAKTDTLQTLIVDIDNSLSNGTPELVLDRLHTFSTKFLREVCEKHNIETQSANGDYYPLQNLAGSIKKYYEKSNKLESTFAINALKNCISLFNDFNTIRNDHSYAHDNPILNITETTFAIRIISSALVFIDEIENLNTPKLYLF